MQDYSRDCISLIGQISWRKPSDLRSLDDVYAGLAYEAAKTKPCWILFPACEAVCCLWLCLLSLRPPWKTQMSTAIAATTANTAAAETAAKIYHGVPVLLDRIPVNEERAYWDNVMMILTPISSFYRATICGEKFVGLVIRPHDSRSNSPGLSPAR